MQECKRRLDEKPPEDTNLVVLSRKRIPWYIRFRLWINNVKFLR
jgi:hypothetical protein